MRLAAADCPVVAMKRSNDRGAKGMGHLVSRTRRETRCCERDEGRSLGVTLWKGASNRHELLRSKGVVVNVMVKRRG
jgi:hypothetical protein